jgi:CHRD domain/Bacterial Ig-like domain
MVRLLHFCAAAACGLVAISGCGDSGSGGNGNIVMQPPPANTANVTADLSADQVVGGSNAGGTAAIDLTVDLDDGSVTGAVTLAGVTATEVSVRSGFAGEQGPALLMLQQDSATHWSMPANAQLTTDDLDALARGALYALVSTAAQPNGALRAQLTRGSVSVLFVDLSDAQEVPLLTSAATAVAAVTLDRDSGAITVHVNTTGLDDAVAAHVHNAVAGVNGDILFGLNQDPTNVKHWSSDNAMLDAAGLAAFDAAHLYVNVHTPANTGGEARGQIVPAGMTVLIVPMSGDEEVGPVATAARATAAITLNPAFPTGDIVVHVNTAGLDDAIGAHVHQAPLGANGPVLFGLNQDPNDPTHWLSDNAVLDAAGIAAFNAGELYVNVHTPANPDGEVRGQIVPPSTTPTVGSFIVTNVVPAAGANLTAWPNQITVTFNRSVAAASVTASSVRLTASGGDGSFGDGNETAITPTALSASGSVATIDVSGVSVADDTFQLTLKGNGTDVITDSNGNVLDGDLDDSAGGDFTSAFTVATSSTVTFQSLQDTVFTPSCALSGCHAGATPQQGMNLSQGQAYAAIVNVPSMEVPTLLRVKPGDPDQSYLVQKIEGTAAVGGRMPLGGPALPADRIEAIRQWISEGAPNAASVPAPAPPPGY